MAEGYEYDYFLSHAFEDQAAVATPLAQGLQEKGIDVWYSGFELQLGDSITGAINEAFRKSRYVLVLFSPTFVEKNWAMTEFRTAFAKEMNSNTKKVIPLVYGMSFEQFSEAVPLAADKLAVFIDNDLTPVIDKLVDFIKNPNAKRTPSSSTFQPAPSKKTPNIIEKLSNGREAEAIELLLEASKSDKHYYHQMILLSGQWRSINNDLTMGLQSQESASPTINRIRQALISIADQLGLS